MWGFLSYIFTATIRLGTPIAITSVGACYGQRTGVNNLGLEGFMAMGAFVAVAGSHVTGNPWIGILFACIAGAAMAVIHGFVTITCGGNMAVSSQALVMLSTGVVALGLLGIFDAVGFSPKVTALTKTELFEGIPVIGEWLSGFSPLIYIGIIMIIMLNYLLYKTPVGLRMMSCGEHPRAADTAGIPVNTMRYIGVILSGVFGGFAGAILSVGSMNLYQEGMISGRGYLALGAVMLGGYSLKGAFCASMLFGFFDALQLYFQAMPNSFIPSQFIQLLPYLASLIILIVGSSPKRKSNVPAAVGKPYSFVSGTR